MTQERITAQITAQIKLRLRHYLEHRDGPGVCAFTTWLVHRHGHSLLQQLLSQPEWSSHRLWWGQQISHLNPDLQPRSQLQPQAHHRMTGPAGKQHQGDKTDDKIPRAAKGPSGQLEPAPSPQPHPEPQEGLPLDRRPASQTESPNRTHDHIKVTPAQVGKQRLKLAKAARPIPIQGEDGTIPTVTPAASKRQLNKGSRDRQHRSRRLRGWLPSSHLPHQLPQQDAA